MMHYKIIHLVILTIFTFSNVWAFENSSLHLPVMKNMPGAHYRWVARSIVYNGKLMSIRNFSSDKNIQEVLRYYMSKFKSKGNGSYRVIRIGTAEAIAYEYNGILYSIEVKQVMNGIVGTETISNKKKYQGRHSTFPIEMRGKLLTKIIHIDEVREAETLILSSHGSIDSILNWYRSAFRRSGWSRYVHRNQNNTYEEQYQKGREYCQILYTTGNQMKQEKILIQIHWVKG